MSAPCFEAVLARLYTEPEFLEFFLCDARAALAGLELTAEEREELLAVDRVGLRMAASGFAAKRARHGRSGGKRRGWLPRLTRRLRLI